jgi:hypothetical protein
MPKPFRQRLILRRRHSQLVGESVFGTTGRLHRLFVPRFFHDFIGAGCRGRGGELSVCAEPSGGGLWAAGTGVFSSR